MIFDFSRCFYETDKWEFTGVWKDSSKENETHYFSELWLYLPGKKVVVRFYDSDIDEFIKRLSAAVRSQNKVMCWGKSIDEIDKDSEINVHVSGGGLDTYEQNCH